MGWIDDQDFFDAYDEEPALEGVVCERCGAEDLEWERVSGPYSKEGPKYRLIEADGAVHECPPADANEFEIVE